MKAKFNAAYTCKGSLIEGSVVYISIKHKLRALGHNEHIRPKFNNRKERILVATSGQETGCRVVDH